VAFFNLELADRSDGQYLYLAAILALTKNAVLQVVGMYNVTGYIVTETASSPEQILFSSVNVTVSPNVVDAARTTVTNPVENQLVRAGLDLLIRVQPKDAYFNLAAPETLDEFQVELEYVSVGRRTRRAPLVDTANAMLRLGKDSSSATATWSATYVPKAAGYLRCTVVFLKALAAGGTERQLVSVVHVQVRCLK
jgi:hypothetical protein